MSRCSDAIVGKRSGGKEAKRGDALDLARLVLGVVVQRRVETLAAFALSFLLPKEARMEEF